MPSSEVPGSWHPSAALRGCCLSHPVFWCCTTVQIISRAGGSGWSCSSPLQGGTWFFRFWDCNTQFCNFKTFLLLSLVVIILYNSELSPLIPSSEITPCLSCWKLSFNSEMMLVWFSHVSGYELIDFVMLKFTFGLETKLPRCQWRNLNSLNRILFSRAPNQWDGSLAFYIQ